VQRLFLAAVRLLALPVRLLMRGYRVAFRWAWYHPPVCCSQAPSALSGGPAPWRAGRWL